MQIVAQSQTPAKVGYIHLAYIAAQLSNRISKGDLFPAQAYLGAALATAMVFGAIGSRLGSKGNRVRAVKWGALLGLVAGLCVLWMIETAWREQRSNQEVIAHVLNTRQWWALRDPFIAAGMEAAADTNGAAAALAASYYAMKGLEEKKESPELVVKAHKYCEAAAAKGHGSPWVRTNDLAEPSRPEEMSATFKAALETGRLSPAEETWAKQKLAELAKRIEVDNKPETK